MRLQGREPSCALVRNYAHPALLITWAPQNRVCHRVGLKPAPSRHRRSLLPFLIFDVSVDANKWRQSVIACVAKPSKFCLYNPRAAAGPFQKAARSQVLPMRKPPPSKLTKKPASTDALRRNLSPATRAVNAVLAMLRRSIWQLTLICVRSCGLGLRKRRIGTQPGFLRRRPSGAYGRTVRPVTAKNWPGSWTGPCLAFIDCGEPSLRGRRCGG